MMLQLPSLTRPTGHSSDLTRLSVAFTCDGSCCELRLAGSLDAYSLVALRAQVDQFSLEPFEEVVVRADELEEIDQAGLDALAGLRALVEERGAQFRLQGMRMKEPLSAGLRDSATSSLHHR